SGDATMSAIALSYRSLNNALQGLILMLGATFKGQASVDFISAVSGVPEAGISQAMTVLSQLYLVEKFDVYGKPYYRMHPKVYEFAQAALTGKNQLDALQQKVHDTTLTYAEDNKDNAQNLAKEMDNFIATAKWASENGNRDTANKLVSVLTDADDLIQEQGYVYEMLTLRNLGSGDTQAFPAYPEEMAITDDEDEDDEFYNYDLDEFGDEEIDDDEAYDDDEEYDDFDEFDEDLYEDDLEDSIINEEDSKTFETPDLGDLNIIEGMSSQA